MDLESNRSTTPGIAESLVKHPDLHAAGTIVAIVGSACCGVLVLAGLGYLVYQLYWRINPKDEEYEKILPTRRPSHSDADPSPPTRAARDKAQVNSSLGMRTIPFTLPPSPHPGGRRLQQDDTASQSSMGSEPASPMSTMSRGSVESFASAATTEFRGAYSLGSIDPSLYKMAEEDDDYDIPERHIGRLWFAVEYERESEKLLVTLMKAKNLPSRALGTGNACDPFVRYRIFLMPDERRYLQSKFKKKSCNPKFEESFVFQVSNKGLEERVLKLTMYDVDRHKRHNIIGHALYPLKEHNYDSNERVVIWRDLEREVSETTLERGEIHVSMCYNNHLERLTVNVFEGRSFKQEDAANPADFYTKVCLQNQGKMIKSKKTEVVKRTSNPAFNESFSFKISEAALDIASVSITVIQHHSGAKDKTLGRVVLGSFMFARGKELEHWNDMVGKQREQISQWHVLT